MVVVGVEEGVAVAKVVVVALVEVVVARVAVGVGSQTPTNYSTCCAPCCGCRQTLVVKVVGEVVAETPVVVVKEEGGVVVVVAPTSNAVSTPTFAVSVLQLLGRHSALGQCSVSLPGRTVASQTVGRPH
eukprot:COSAG05_NODE_32_length_28165_cov_450.666714_31_plen_129_part_00